MYYWTFMVLVFFCSTISTLFEQWFYHGALKAFSRSVKWYWIFVITECFYTIIFCIPIQASLVAFAEWFSLYCFHVRIKTTYKVLEMCKCNFSRRGLFWWSAFQFRLMKLWNVKCEMWNHFKSFFQQIHEDNSTEAHGKLQDEVMVKFPNWKKKKKKSINSLRKLWRSVWRLLSFEVDTLKTQIRKQNFLDI